LESLLCPWPIFRLITPLLAAFVYRQISGYNISAD
jgi:hypothetical protein